MTSDGEGEPPSVLADHRLGRLGVQIKLDKGFEPGTYCVCIEFDGLADRVGFAAARRSAREYCALLKGQLSHSPGYSVGETEDPSRSGDGRRKRDMDATFLSFSVET